VVVVMVRVSGGGVDDGENADERSLG